MEQLDTNLHRVTGVDILQRLTKVEISLNNERHDIWLGNIDSTRLDQNIMRHLVTQNWFLEGVKEEKRLMELVWLRDKQITQL